MKRSLLLCLVLSTTHLLADEGTTESLESRVAVLEQQLQTMESADRAPQPTMADGFVFDGYFRAGLGVNGKGDSMEAFKAPNSGAKYRLGNETEAYVEATFRQNFLSRELLDDQVDFFTLLTFAYVTPTANNNAFDTTTSMREVYAGARGVWNGNKEAMFWAGNRFYEHLDIHMNDFFFRDMAGFGGGVEDVALGDMKWALAWLGGTIDELSSDGTAYENDYHFNKNTIDLRLYDIGTGIGKLALNADITHFGGDTLSPDTDPANDIIIDGSSGWALGAILASDLTDNLANRFTAQYGAGAAENFKAVITAPQGVTVPDTGGLYIDTGEASRLRITDDIVIQTGKPLSLQAAAIYERYDNGMDSMNTIDWVSLGVRPVYHFNDYFSLACEVGADYTNQKDGIEGVLGKLTLAPQIQPGLAHFARPSIRAFATLAAWSDGFEGSVAPIGYGSDTSGLSFGVQMEAWW